MKEGGIYKVLPIFLLAAFFAFCIKGGYGFDPALAVAADSTDNVVKGQVLGKSNKAKTISIKDGDATVMIKFDDNTKGLEHATKGHAAIVRYEMLGEDKVATEIKPKLAKLPDGVKEMSVEELAALVAKGPAKGNYFLVDSRPGKRFDAGHIPTAVSIPVKKLEETGSANLPGDAKIKNTLLVFYCGGPT